MGRTMGSPTWVLKFGQGKAEGPSTQGCGPWIHALGAPSDAAGMSWVTQTAQAGMQSLRPKQTWKSQCSKGGWTLGFKALHRAPDFAGMLLVVAMPSGIAGWLKPATVPARIKRVRTFLCCLVGFNVFSMPDPLELRVHRKPAPFSECAFSARVGL